MSKKKRQDGAERFHKFSERLEAKGGRRFTTYIGREAAGVLTKLQAQGNTVASVVERGIIMLGKKELHQ